MYVHRGAYGAAGPKRGRASPVMCICCPSPLERTRVEQPHIVGVLYMLRRAHREQGIVMVQAGAVGGGQQLQGNGVPKISAIPITGRRCGATAPWRRWERTTRGLRQCLAEGEPIDKHMAKPDEQTLFT